MQLGFIIALQALALVFGASSIACFHVISFPSLAMLFWGSITMVAMLVLVLAGRFDLLYRYGVKGSLLAMICINLFLGIWVGIRVWS